MTTPVGDDGSFWIQFTASAVAVIGAMLGTVRWLLGKIEAVRVANDRSVERLRAEIGNKIDANAREYREDQNRAMQWREGVLATMVTRAEADRMLDRQTNQLLEALDTRFRPLVERRARRGSSVEGD